MTNFPSLRISFLKNNKYDDYVIHNTWSENQTWEEPIFNVRFRSSTPYEDGSPFRSRDQEFTGTSLKHFLWLLLDLAVGCIDPYEEIQVDYPNGLQVLHKINDLNDYEVKTSLLQMAELCIISWPKYANEYKCKTSTTQTIKENSHIFFDDNCNVIARY